MLISFICIFFLMLLLINCIFAAASRFQDNDNSGKGLHGTDTDNLQIKDNDHIHNRSKFASETDESEVSIFSF